jgi:hypothetical protein
MQLLICMRIFDKKSAQIDADDNGLSTADSSTPTLCGGAALVIDARAAR